MGSSLPSSCEFSLAERGQTGCGRVLVKTKSNEKIYSQALKCEAIPEGTKYGYVSIKKTCFSCGFSAWDERSPDLERFSLILSLFYVE